VTGAVLLIAGLTLFDYFAFVRLGFWLNFLFPATTFVLICALIVGGKYAIEWRRQRFIRDAFSRYLHPDLVEELCQIQTPLRLGGEERELTVLFADIRDFTHAAVGQHGAGHRGKELVHHEVNVAARLEAANKTLGTDILVSASTSKTAGADAVFRPRGVVEAKGRKEPVAVFELLAVAAAEG
jgi:class 3 adenylate cyclase